MKPSTFRLAWFASALLLSCGAPPEGAHLCVETKQDALRVCSGSSTVPGLDVSYYQGSITWSSVKSAGYKFAITRVSDGATYYDSKFATNWAAIKQQGMVRGVYQFFRPGQDPTTQANFLLSKVAAAGGFKADDLPVVMDIEVTDGVAATTIRSRMQTWLDKIQAATGKKPIIYTANFMSATIGNGFSAYPLWVANYGATCPLMPSNWGSWKIWQWSSTASVSGISGSVDVDKWNGTYTSLVSYVTPPTADAGHADAGHADAGTHDAGTHDGGLMLFDGGADEPDAGDTGDQGLVMGDGRLFVIQGCAP